MDVNIEIDELVLDGTDDVGLQDVLQARLDPMTAPAVARSVAEALKGVTDPPNPV